MSAVAPTEFQGQPSIRHDRFRFVPIVPARINFAVLVRRAVTQVKQHSGHFVLAVQLPRSIEGPFREAIAALPRVSLLVAHPRGERRQLVEGEVFPITPCDGIVEAVRLAAADADGITLRCIDSEIAPPSLMRRQCLPNPNWPDDRLVLVRGAADYLGLIEDDVCVPPLRFEPVDTWREIHMANQLRSLYCDFPHSVIVVVCDVAHVEPIREQLRQTGLLAYSGEEVLPDLDVRQMQPSLEVLLSYYLDDIPKLVELYEVHRNSHPIGDGVDFDKTSALVAGIRDVEVDVDDCDFAPNHYQAFQELLRKLQSTSGARNDLEAVVEAGVYCFGKGFHTTVRRRLLEYFDQVSVDRIGRMSSAARASGGSQFVSRRCSPFWSSLTIVPPPQQDKSSTIWPEHKRFLNVMRRRAFELAALAEQTVRSGAFRGSIEVGIDLRATLRSQVRLRLGHADSVRPQLYVKRRNSKVTVARGLEPVVWILNPKAEGRFKIAWFGRRDKPRYVNWLCFFPPRRMEHEDERLRVWLESMAGALSFCEMALPLRVVQREYGPDFERRVPAEATFVEIEGYGWVPPEVARFAHGGRPWWDLLLLSAVEYAVKSIPYVAPTGFSISREIADYAGDQGKSFVRAPLSGFSPDEQRQLATWYTMGFPKGLPADESADVNEPDVLAFLEKEYRRRHESVLALSAVVSA